jgi:hypothetical protein
LVGATGTNTGNGITIDTNGHLYIVGGINQDSGAVEFVNGLQPTIPNVLDKSIAYITQYNQAGLVAQRTACISLDSGALRPDGSSCAPTGDDYVVANKVVVATDNRIYVLGIYKGCDLVLYDDTGGVVITTNSAFSAMNNQKVFLASYDSTLKPLSCHIFCTENNENGYAEDIARAEDPNDGTVRVYMCADFNGDFINVEKFGSGSSPNPTYNPIATQDMFAYDIFLAQIVVSNDYYEKAVTIGGPGNDFSSELSTGYLGMYESTDLFMTGAFEDSISFNHSSSGLMTKYSNGFFDLFACKMPGFDITTQDPCVAGGPWNEQALSMTDDGKFVGGFVNEGAQFDTNGVVYTVPSGPYPINLYTNYGAGARTEMAFIAQPNYASGDWYSVDTVVQDSFDTQTNTMASSVCGDFMASFGRGMHGGVFNLPPDYYMNGIHLFNGSISGDAKHVYYSTLMKWASNGTNAVHVWSYDFWPTTRPPFGNTHHIGANYIEDMEYNIKGDGDPLIPVDVGSGSTDFLFTGRFGDTITVPTSSGQMEFRGNTTTPYLHGGAGMFLGGMHEIGPLAWDTISVCRTDTVRLPIILDTLLPPSVLALIDTNSIYYTGPGILDSINRIFSPTTYGGFHHIQGHYDYFGCNVSSLALVIMVHDDPFPIQPLTVNNNMAEGMAVAAKSPGIKADFGDYPLYFNAGFYQDTIQFEKHDGSYITLVSNAGIESGYVVCYDPCGAVWATNFQCSGVGGYVENIVLGKNGDLYVCGAVDGPLDIQNSKGYASPIFPLNIGSMNMMTTNFPEKGFVAKLEQLTGKVDWVYLGGDVSTESSRFHGLAIDSVYLGVIGEFSGNISGNFGGGPVMHTSIGGEDVFYMYLDTTGTSYDAAFFGTVDDDHGDAIDLGADLQPGSLPDDMEFLLTGYLEAGSGLGNTVNHNFGVGPTGALGSGNGHELFTAIGHMFPSFGLLSENALKVYAGAGDDEGFDIIYTDPETHSHSPNTAMVCGRFEDAIFIPGTSTTYSTSGTTDFDGFVMGMNNSLIANWFSPEGTAINADECVHALTMLGDSVFATGQIMGNSTGTLTAGASFAPFRVGLYVTQFSTSGTQHSIDFAIPSAAGINSSTDISVIDTSLLTTGFLGIPNADYVVFNDTIWPNSNGTNHEVFIARTNMNGSLYFKHRRIDQRDVSIDGLFHVFPNPNRGGFTVSFESEISGKLSIISLNGQFIHQEVLGEVDRVNIELNLPPGIYYIQVNSDLHSETQSVIILD